MEHIPELVAWSLDNVGKDPRLQDLVEKGDAGQLAFALCARAGGGSARGQPSTLTGNA
jgi:hypothetical protein